MNFDFESRLLDVRNETHDVKTFRFEAPDSFTFIPGQFIMMEIAGKDGKSTRPFSISSSPTKKGFVEITKKIGESEFSRKLNEAEKGFSARIRGPFGMFVFDEKQDAILLAGGIGVTPFRSFMEYATDKKLQNRITLFYSNKTQDDIAFKEEFEELAKKNHNIKIVSTVTRPLPEQNWNGLVGRIDENMIKHNADTSSAIFYICGPPAMVDSMINMVKGMNVQKERIRTERFFGY